MPNKELKKHYIVYETINLVNGRKYIGKHSTKNLNDSYLGSGLALRNAVKKYGKENFKRTILADFRTEEEAFDYEIVVVKERKAMDNKEYYNVSSGGKGGYNKGTEKLWKSTEFRKKRSEEVKKQWQNPKMRMMLSEKAKKEWQNPEYRKLRVESMKKKWQDPEYRKNKEDSNRGENSKKSKLTNEQVREIRKKLSSGMKHKDISDEYGVTIYCIRNIRYNRTWKSVR